MKYIKILFLLSLIWANFGPKIGSHPIFQMANASNFNAIYDFRLKLDEAVPFRVYSFNHPNRIVLELHTSAIKGLENLEVTSSPFWRNKIFERFRWVVNYFYRISQTSKSPKSNHGPT